jgi:hypothetical protein
MNLHSGAIHGVDAAGLGGDHGVCERELTSVGANDCL